MLVVYDKIRLRFGRCLEYAADNTAVSSAGSWVYWGRILLLGAGLGRRCGSGMGMGTRHFESV